MSNSIECPESTCDYEGNFRGFTSHCIATHPKRHEEIRRKQMIHLYKESVGVVEVSPKFKDIKEDLPFGKQPIYNLFGNYKNFVEETGIEHYHLTQNKILNSLKKISKEELDGGCPTVSDIEKYTNFSSKSVYRLFGSVTNALEDAGFRDIQYKNVSKERLIEEIDIVSEKINSSPSSRDMRKHGIFSVQLFRRRFGSWNNAIEEAGYDPIPQHAQGKDNPMFGMTGEDNPNYGNTGEDNPSYIHGSPDNPHADIQYRRNRRKLMNICGGICQHPECLKEESDHGIDLDCHHIVPHKLLPEGEKHSIENLIILCREHHAEVEPPKRCKTESQHLS